MSQPLARSYIPIFGWTPGFSDHATAPPAVARQQGALLGDETTQTTVSRLLAELGEDRADTVDQVFALLYEELRELARRQRQRWHDDYTLDTTGLVHEAYLKLVGRAGAHVESRAHFLALASRSMRHILCNYARDRRALKRGGVQQPLPLDEAAALTAQSNTGLGADETLLALDEALKRLEQVDPRRSKVVECRFFGGLTVDETATAIGVSARTVKRDWALAQAWLHREMSGDA